MVLDQRVRRWSDVQVAAIGPERNRPRAGDVAVTPRVSVVLPVHDRRNVVERAVESVLAQTMSDLELVVVDDASTDGSFEVVERIAVADARVVPIRLDRNVGPAAARNRGIDRASADLVAFQDSDDRWLPDKLERQLAAIDDADVCYCAALYVSADGCYRIPRSGTLDAPTDRLLEQVLVSNPITPQTLLIRRSILCDLGGFDESLTINEDWDLAIRLAASPARFAHVDEPLAVIHRTDGSVSSDRRADIRFREDLLVRYGEHYDRCRPARASQHYIVGRMLLDEGRWGHGGSHLLRAARFARTPAGVIRLLRRQRGVTP